VRDVGERQTYFRNQPPDDVSVTREHLRPPRDVVWQAVCPNRGYQVCTEEEGVRVPMLLHVLLELAAD